jgi:outer membrane receptor for ferrienterochelin and colicins
MFFFFFHFFRFFFHKNLFNFLRVESIPPSGSDFGLRFARRSPKSEPRIFVFLTIFLIVLFSAARAQTSGNDLRIAVKDANGAAVAGASVVLRNTRTGLERGAASDTDGVFVFRNLEPGAAFEISILREGFARAEKKSVKAGEQVEIVLQPSKVQAEVTIYSAARQDELRESLNTKVEVLTAAQIRETGYETVGEILREVPGVLTRRGSEGSIAGEQIQGIDSRQVLILFDNFPVIGARGIKRGVLNLDRQSTANLQQVEVVKGASSALFGSDAIGGVINLIPRSASRLFEGDVRVSGGDFGVFDAAGTIGFSRKNLNSIFTLERHKRNEVDLTPTTFDTTLPGFHRTDFYARPQYKFSEKFKLTSLFDGYWNRQTGRALGEEGNQFNQISENSQAYGLTADWQFGERGNAQFRGYFTRWDEITRGQLNNAARTALPDGNLFERLGQLDASATYVLGERQILQFGGEWRTVRYRGINRLRDDAGERADTRNFWAQDKINLTNRLTATVGARFDNHSVFGSAVSPKIGLNLRATRNLNLRVSWGRGYRAPDLGQLYFRFLNPTNFYQVIGNPNLRPEHGGSWQAGGEFQAFNRRVRIGANFFRNDVRNLIDSVSLGFIATPAQLNAVVIANGIDSSFRPVVGRLLFYYKNLSNIHTQGFEFDADARLLKNFSVGGAYTYLDARDKKTDLYLPGRNRNQGFVKFAYANDVFGFRTNLRGSFYSSWIVSRTAAGIETVAPAFQIWDFYAAKSVWRKNFEIFGAIDNLLDNRDPNTGRTQANGITPLPLYRPEIGRSFRVGMRWNFGRNE